MRLVLGFALVAAIVGSIPGGSVEAVTTTTYRDVVMSDGPTAYWRLADLTGTTAIDELAANPGTYFNGVLLNQPGALASEMNASASLDGINDYVSIPSSNSLNMTSAVTVEFWAKRRTASGTYQVVVGKPGDGQSKNENYAVWLNTGNRYQAYFGNGTTFISVSTAAVLDTNWHHVVATDDGTTARIYLDGTLQASTAATVALTANTKPLNFGRANSNAYFFNGWLDEVALYPTALSAARIQAHYTKGVTDQVAPAVSLTSPSGGSYLGSPNVAFAGTAGSAVGDSSTVTIKIYAGSSASGSPAQTLSATRQADNSYSASTTLSDGTWTAQAEQLDTAGNLGQSSANTFTVATTPPVTTISGPLDPTNQTTGTLTFTADRNVAFQCALDGGAFAACSSPKTYSGLTDARHTFQVTATDPAGNTSTTSYSWTVDTIAPPSPAITSGPPAQTGSTDASFVFSDAEGTATLLCQLDGGGFNTCTSPQNYTGLASGVHTFEVKARDAAGNQSASTSYTWTIGAAVPAPSLDSTPPNPSNSTSASFSFSDSPPAVSFECSLDGTAFAACTSPFAASGLADGSHTFAVRALDSAGNTSPAQRYTWTIDTAAPFETITSQPPNPSNSTTPSFSFTADETVTFECSLDGADYVPCSSPQGYSGVAEGSHTFALRATDGAGNQSTLTYGWTVDLTAPTTTITSAPPNPSSNPNPNFSFTTSETASTVCSLDGATFSACASPQSYSNLADGAHTFRVRARDLAGNVGQAASYGWTVDTGAPPVPTITSGPPSSAGSTSATFGFTDSEADASLFCQLDGGAFDACTSPRTYSGLAEGSHTFAVKARDAGGNESAPATYTWTVDVTPPVMTLASTPVNPTNQATASFGFSANETASFQCKLDGSAFVSCASPQGYTGLGQGSHTFQVRATDQAGNVGAAVSFTWTVDLTSPTVTLTSPENGATRAEWPTFTGTAGSASGDSNSVTVKLYAGSQATGTPLQSVTGTVGAGAGYAVTASAPLAQGTYTAQTQQADAAGNIGLSSANTFTVGDPVVLAAGDIAYCPTDGASRTGPLLSRDPDALVMPLGDIAYNNGQPEEYQGCYDPTWGYAKARTRPLVGPHDEGVPGGSPYPAGWGYVNYFANQLAPFAPTGNDITKLYYSYDLGSWHVVVLNDSCIDGTTPNCDEAAQEQWLTNDLAGHSNLCTLAVWHRPRWTSDSIHGPGWQIMGRFWSILYQYGVDLILNGSAHDYERFAPQDPAGNMDSAYGIREMIVGTGGNFTYSLGTLLPNSQVFDSSSYGVLRLGLHAMSYDWQFVPVADGGLNGGNFTDSGTTTCHGRPQDGSYHDAVLAASPSSYWRLGETSGTTAADEIGQNPGTYSNVLLNQPGALSNDANPSASFSGSASYAIIPSSSSLNMSQAVTVEVWAKRRVVSGAFQVLVGKPGDGQSKNENYAVWLASGRYQAYFGNGSRSVSVATAAPADTNWHYVVATDDGSTAKIYVDGVLKASTSTTLQLTPNSKPLNFGRANNNTYFFNGWLDEVAIYPSALSASTIQAHYTAAVAPAP